jgi:hypothetical protein
MTLAREWVGGVFRASAATLVAPAAILLAVALSATGGGLQGLGSLGELISGPAPRADVEASVGAQNELAGGETVVLAPPVVAPAGASRVGSGVSGGGGAVGAPAPTGGPIAEVQPPSSAPGPGVPAPRVPPQPPAPRQPSVVEDLGDSAKGVTEALPGPLGPTVNGLLDQVVGTCRELSCP